MALTRLRTQPVVRTQTVVHQRMPLLKKLFWVYFLLLFFEGALRKWIVPSLSGPLLIVRDPIAIMIIWEAYRTHKWPRQWSSVTAILAVGIVGLSLLQLVAGEGVWFAALFGLRSYLLPFPVAFIMAENLNAEDLRKFANCTLFLLLPLTVLEVIQYYAPAGSFWNAATSSDTVQLAYAAGHVRASATFSYVTGPMGYLPLSAAFIFYGLANPGFVKKWLLWASSFALVLAIPVTGSRTVVFELAGVVACVGIAAMFGMSQFVKSLQMILGMVFIALLVSQLPVFSEASATFGERFTEATAAEGGSTQESFILRIFVPVTNAIQQNVGDNNWFGVGMGRGAVAIFAFMGGVGFAAAGENEFERVVAEFGWPGGFAFMLFRYLLTLFLISKAIRQTRDGQPLALLLVPLAINTVAFGVLEQPTTQGFMVMSLAFSLAHTNHASFPIKSMQYAFVGRRQRRLGLNAS